MLGYGEERKMLFDRGSRHKIYIEIMERELKRLEDGDLAGLRFVYGAFATQDTEDRKSVV